ncbi:MAG TPA: hypothetical protein VGH74_18670 [Planctomycetaceae bacterium]|jgi:hypothetical protein
MAKRKPAVWIWATLVVGIALCLAYAISFAPNPEKFVLWSFAVIFASMTARSLWRGYFFYRYGERIDRRKRPFEFWFVMSLAIAATAIIWIIAL